METVMIKRNIIVKLFLGVLFVLAIEATAEQRDSRLFPTALGPGQVTADGRFEKETVIPREKLPRQVMSTDNARFKVDLDKLLEPHDMTWKDNMPSYFYDGAPLGNGDIGAIIYGYPDNLHIVLSKTDVWDRRNDVLDVTHFPGENYDQFRQTYFDNDEDGYVKLTNAAATARRGKTVALPHMTTCGQIQLCIDGGIRKRNVQMNVSLKEGLMNLIYNNKKIQAVVSREYDVLLVDIDRGKPKTIPGGPLTFNQYGTNPRLEQLPWELRRSPLEGNDNAECVSDGRFHFVTQRFRADGHYTIGVTFTNFDKEDSAILPTRIVGQLSEIQQRRCQMYATIVSSEDTQDTIAECKRRLQRAVSAGADKIIEKNNNWWRDYWMRGLASVADKAVEKWYYMSLYHCGAAYEPGRQSPGLQGVWCGYNFPQWCGDFHSNINIQSNYWGLMTNNRLDLMEPYISYYNRIADISRRMAKEYYKMRGLRFPHAGSIGGTELCMPGMYMLATDPCGSAWIGQLLWQYYQYSLDKNYLRKIAYPLLRDVALFYADFMVRDKKSGKWVLTPSLHMEKGHRKFGEPFYLWGDNSLWAQAFFRLGFNIAIEAAAALGVDEEYQALWRERLANMAEVPASKEGHWKYWDNHEIGGLFMLVMVYPAELVSRFHGPDKWQQQAMKTVDYYTDKGGRFSWPWCGGMNICGMLRLGKVDEAFAGASWKDTDNENGFVVVRRNAYIQTDHPAGMCRVLADMLVLGLDGTIHLFAGLPENQPARCLSLRAPGGFLITAEKRGTELDYAIIQPTAGKKLKLANPWNSTVTVTDLKNNKVVYTTEKPIIEVGLEIGHEYLIAKKGFDITDLVITDFGSY